MPDDRRPVLPPLTGEHDLAHAIVEGALALVFPDPAARDAIGLRAVSRASHGATAWYLWTRRHRGAFEIALLPQGSAGEALLALRYFPDPGEPLFAGFAAVERDARTDGRFDATGTPRRDVAATLDPSLFHVGTLALADDGATVALALEAQDRWVEETRVGGRWVSRRDVPGLALAFAVLDPLACALAFLGRRPPASVRARRGPALRWRVDGDAATSAVDPALAHWRIEARGFLAPGRRDEQPQAAPPAPACVRDADLMFPAIRRWWEAPAWRFAPVGTFCAHCAAEEADHGH